MTSLSHWEKKGPEILQMLFIWGFPIDQSHMQKTENTQAEEQQRSTAVAVVRNNRNTFELASPAGHSCATAPQQGLILTAWGGQECFAAGE